MIQLTKEEKSYYKKMLSNTSKLGVKSISLDANKCKTGGKLAKKKAIKDGLIYIAVVLAGCFTVAGGVWLLLAIISLKGR